MPTKRKISAAEFVKDLRSGMTLSELMNKYSLVPRELDDILLQLKQSLVNPLEIYGRSSTEQTGKGTERIRFFRRHQVGLPVRVYDEKDSAISGQIKDISERGVGVQGIEAQIDDIRTLVVLSNEFFAINQFKMLAKCRWTSPTRDAKKCLTGFEIISISETSFDRLKRFIEACSRAEQASRVLAGSAASEPLASRQDNTRTFWVCPFCQKPQERQYEECPQCGIIAKKYMQRLDTAKGEILRTIEKESPPEAAVVSQKESMVTKTISISTKLWSELEALGGNPDDHVVNAISTYVLRSKLGRHQA